MEVKLPLRETTIETLGSEENALAGIDKDHYPHLFSFIAGGGFGCQATIDVVKIFDDGAVECQTDQAAQTVFGDSGPPKSANTAAVIYIVEEIDVSVIGHLRARVGQNTASFLRFLDAHLDDSPSYNFYNVEHHLDSLPSMRKRDEHVKFVCNHAREFDHNFPISYEDLQAAAGRHSWRARTNFGSMAPTQRMELDGKYTNFAPILVSRNHLAAWFGTGSHPTWQTGIILVDRPMNIRDLPGALVPPLYPKVVGRGILPKSTAETSYRSSISLLMKHSLGSMTGGVPPPFIVLEGLYRILAAEWVITNTYVYRDINAIEWKLQDGRQYGLQTAEQFEETLRTLFFMRRRVNRYQRLVREQQEAISAHGPESWNRGYGPDSSFAPALTQVSSMLVDDYSAVLTGMAQNYHRVEQNLGHISSLSSAFLNKVSVREAERGVEQNRMVLLLAVVATFFLPISTTSTVLNMSGDWAPWGSDFGLFWAITLPLSALLMALLLAMRFWPSIVKTAGRLHDGNAKSMV